AAAGGLPPSPAPAGGVVDAAAGAAAAGDAALRLVAAALRHAHRQARGLSRDDHAGVPPPRQRAARARRTHAQLAALLRRSSGAVRARALRPVLGAGHARFAVGAPLLPVSRRLTRFRAIIRAVGHGSYGSTVRGVGGELVDRRLRR